MGQALYRKYRSKSLSEIVGQEHITQALEQAIKTNRISHAYLFTGPRGVGKTSIARILAHEINHLPYTDDQTHLDIIEIDAASNRRIDEIRELRERVYVAPTSAAYKVYIIDEVHMLTREAFNALLKTLEEPPAHVVFILATTDAHKLPATIISRTQRYSFKPGTTEAIVGHLGSIAKQENIDISQEALYLIAEHGDGSFRDSVGLLDQASNQASAVSVADVQLLLGIPPTTGLESLVAHVAQHDTLQALQTINGMYEQGYQASVIAKQLGQLLRHQLTEKQQVLSLASSLPFLTQLLEVPASHDPERLLEILVLAASSEQNLSKLASPNQEQQVASQQPQASVATKPSPKLIKPAELPEASPNLTKPSVAAVAEQSLPAATNSASALLDEAIWPAILATLKQQYNTLYGIVRMAQADFSQTGTLTLTFAFAFHQKRIKDAKNQKIIADCIAQVTGQQVEIICLVDKDLQLKKNTPAPVAPSNVETTNPLTTISNIFGGGELLES